MQRIGLACGLIRRLGALSGQLLHQEHEQGADLRLVAVQEGLVADLALVAQVLEEQRTVKACGPPRSHFLWIEPILSMSSLRCILSSAVS